MSGWVEGKVALVIGGGSGIGRAVVELFVQEGASVAVLERDEGKCSALGALGPSVDTVPGDATRAADVERAASRAVERFGRLDTLLTFIGTHDHYAPLADLTPTVFDAAFDEMFDVNVRSVLLGVRASHDALRANRGSVVVTASSSSFFPGRGGILYVASKFALRGVIAQLAHELAPDIRVNGVAPGGTIDTDLRGLEALGQGQQRLADRPGRVDGLKARTPLGVALESADHAAAYLYLASSRSRGVTGEIIRSDGGLSVR